MNETMKSAPMWTCVLIGVLGGVILGVVITLILR
jgi:hypothetical protein